MTLAQKLKRKIREMAAAIVYPQPKRRDDPDDGPEGAGVTARLKPPPPVLSAAAANPLPTSGRPPT